MDIVFTQKEILLILGILLFVFVLILRYIAHERRQLFELRVKKSSKRYKALMKLNERTDFDWDIREVYMFSESVKSKAQYDRFIFDRFLEKTIEENLSQFSDLVFRVAHNQAWYIWYRNEIEELPAYSERNIAIRKNVPVSQYMKIERELCEKGIAYPVVQPDIQCFVEYRSMHGRNEYHDTCVYSFNDFLRVYTAVKDRIESRGTAYYQRKAMTQSLRYDIMKRDGFRCVLCGRTPNDGVKLHVDHIVPVSKGGKTEVSNLRTLCSECNMGKRDKYDEFGYN